MISQKSIIDFRCHGQIANKLYVKNNRNMSRSKIIRSQSVNSWLPTVMHREILREGLELLTESLMTREVVAPDDTDVLLWMQEAAARHGNKLELIDGILLLHGVATPRHQLIVTDLPVVLAPVRENWRIMSDGHIELFPKTRVLPDCCGWKRPADDIGRNQTSSIIKRRPDWVCEVLSPSTFKDDVGGGSKFKNYEKARIPYYWIIDPEKRTIDVYQMIDNHYVSIAKIDKNDDTFILAPFDIEIKSKYLYDYIDIK